MTRYAAIIEWSSHDMEPPAVFVADTINDLLPHLIVKLMGLADDAYDDDETFIAEHPYPSIDDVPAMREWLSDMRNATTAPWVEISVLEPVDGVEVGEHLFIPFEQMLEHQS